MNSGKLRVRFLSPWQTSVETEQAIFSTDFSTEEADALLCYWSPSSELFTFPRRKVWYCCEPQCQFRGLGGGTWPKIKARLAPDEFLWHGHPDKRYRVPHVTHFEPLVMNINQDRSDKAIAIVSNYGGAPWKRHPDLSYRNRVITNPSVDLYGRDGWQRYRSRWYSRAKTPVNYKGEIPGDWPAGEKRQLMSKYKVAICLENMNEPYYFSEKFVEAVMAGCIPVYRAHPTIRNSVLRGAAWCDPTDVGSDPHEVIIEALARDLASVQQTNLAWSINQNVASTHASAVFARIGEILAGV
jgi:hypothetical protein